MNTSFSQSLFAWIILLVMLGAFYQIFKRSLPGRVIIGSIKGVYGSLKLSYRILKMVLTRSAKIVEKTCAELEHKNSNFTTKKKSSKSKTVKKVVNITDYRSKH